MSRNGSGTYSLPSNSWNPAVNSTPATAADWQALINDVAAALTQSLSKDGQTPITGNLAMSGNKITGLAAATALGDALRFDQLYSQGALVSLASAATIDIGAQLSTMISVTGTTGITSFGANFNGPRFLIFAGALTLTHSASLALPGAANITTAAGDAMITVPISGGWRVVAFQRAAALPAIAGPLASSGITGAAASGANSDITSLSGITSVQFSNGSVQSRAVVPLNTRQTCLSGPVDTNGFSAFGGSTGSTTVTAAGTLHVTAANGFDDTGAVDRVGSIVNPSWTGLTASAFLYLDIAADGTCTTGSTTLAPTYRWGGADVTTSGQFTFNIQEMVGKVGNGTTAVQTYRVFVGEVTASGTVSAITWYALMGRYQQAWVSTLPGANVFMNANHNIGCLDTAVKFELQCTVADFGYVVGEIVTDPSSNAGGVASTLTGARTRNSVGHMTANSGGIYALNRTTGANALLTTTSWKYRAVAQRTW